MSGEIINCVCAYDQDGKPVNLCQYHLKLAKTIATESRNAEREGIAQLIEIRAANLRIQSRFDDAIIMKGLAKEVRETKRTIKVVFAKASREELSR